jgi:drug/metabolite transporter (DMT)-like permease
LLFEGIRRIGAADASLISLSGPAITVTAAWLLLDESLATLQCAGLAIVVAGMWMLYRPARVAVPTPVE